MGAVVPSLSLFDQINQSAQEVKAAIKIQSCWRRKHVSLSFKSISSLIALRKCLSSKNRDIHHIKQALSEAENCLHDLQSVKEDKETPTTKVARYRMISSDPTQIACYEESDRSPNYHKLSRNYRLMSNMDNTLEDHYISEISVGWTLVRLLQLQDSFINDVRLTLTSTPVDVPLLLSLLQLSSSMEMTTHPTVIRAFKLVKTISDKDRITMVLNKYIVNKMKSQAQIAASSASSTSFQFKDTDFIKLVDEVDIDMHITLIIERARELNIEADFIIAAEEELGRRKETIKLKSRMRRAVELVHVKELQKSLELYEKDKELYDGTLYRVSDLQNEVISVRKMLQLLDYERQMLNMENIPDTIPRLSEEMVAICGKIVEGSSSNSLMESMYKEMLKQHVGATETGDPDSNDCEASKRRLADTIRWYKWSRVAATWSYPEAASMQRKFLFKLGIHAASIGTAIGGNNQERNSKAHAGGSFFGLALSEIKSDRCTEARASYPSFGNKKKDVADPEFNKLKEGLSFHTKSTRVPRAFSKSSDKKTERSSGSDDKVENDKALSSPEKRMSFSKRNTELHSSPPKYKSTKKISAQEVKKDTVESLLAKQLQLSRYVCLLRR